MVAKTPFTVRTKCEARKHQKLVFTIVHRIRARLPMVRRWGSIEDLIQESTLILHEVIQQNGYDPKKSKSSTYYGRALWNNLVARIGKTSVIKVGRDKLILAGRAKLVDDWWEIPPDLISEYPNEEKERTEERDRIIRTALQSLKRKKRFLVEMKMSGKCITFIASQLNMSRSSVVKNWRNSLSEMSCALESAGVDHYE